MERYRLCPGSGLSLADLLPPADDRLACLSHPAQCDTGADWAIREGFHCSPRSNAVPQRS